MSRGTPHRPIRIDDKLWQAAKDKARDENTKVSEKIRAMMREWLGWTNETEETMKDRTRDDLPVEGRPRSHLSEQ